MQDELAEGSGGAPENGPQPPVEKALESDGQMSEEQLRSILAQQTEAVSRTKALSREPTGAALFVLSLEKHAFEMQNNGRVVERTVAGTTLTPDQDAMDMDATIPKCPEPEAEE